MIRVGIVGCGRIADEHAANIQRIPGCEIVGACDREALMARQLCERFDVQRHFSDPGELIDIGRPDVVHITTPPQSHFELARLCLEAGCNVYVEKPFTLNTAEAERLIALAMKRNLKMTVGHSRQFSHVALRMRELVGSGFLGGAPVHMESIYCYDLGGDRYAKALLRDAGHWVRALPGKLLHNVISHGICRIAEFVADDHPGVMARGLRSRFLKGLGETDIIDELRVVVYCNDSTTAYFTFSTQMRPVMNQFRLYGPANSLIIDDDQQTLIKVKGARYKSYLEQFIPPAVLADQYLVNAWHNVRKFVGRELHTTSGMRFLIESFYRSVADDAPLPISYREILLTARITDVVFEELDAQRQ